MIQPFSVNIPQQALDDLKLRLKNTRWTDEITDSGWNYGTNLSYMKELTDYWLNKFDWRKVENEINAYPNFIADIDGHKIHFIHIKEKGKKSIPAFNVVSFIINTVLSPNCLPSLISNG